MAYIEFSFTKNEDFEKLVKVFDALREAKRKMDFPDEAYWLGFFDEAARKTFWWPTEQEAQAWYREWVETKHHPSFMPDWIFGSLIDAFKNGEYKLISCSQIAAGLGRLEFEPYAWPFGGTSCFHKLLTVFNCQITDENED